MIILAASTITRDTWADDTGTPSAPNLDGTAINNDALQDNIYARIDEMFAGAGAYATFTFGGLVAAEGFGTHTFSAGGAGGQILSVRNTSAGAGNYAQMLIGNNASASSVALYTLSSTYASSGDAQADGGVLVATRAGGLSLTAAHGSGAIRLYTGGTTERMRVHETGGVSIGNTTDPGAGGLWLSGLSGNVAGDTFTSAVGSATNISGYTGQLSFYQRTMDVVHVTIRIDVTSAGAGAVVFRITPPIASDFGAVYDAAGLAIDAAGYGDPTVAQAHVANNEIEVGYNAASGGLTSTWLIAASYRIL